jgi:hypothetical protein
MSVSNSNELGTITVRATAHSHSRASAKLRGSSVLTLYSLPRGTRCALAYRAVVRARPRRPCAGVRRAAGGSGTITR